MALELSHEGFDVVTAEDGRTALEKTETASPDLILLDVMLPRMSGLEVLRKLRAATAPFLPVILVTARGRPWIRLTD